MGTFGNTSTTSTHGTAVADNKYASRFQYTDVTGMCAYSMTAYLSGGTATRNAKFGFYGSSSSTLGTSTALVPNGRCSGVITLTASQAVAWQTLYFPTPCPLTNNWYYWPTVLVDGDMEIWRPTTGGSHGVQNNTYASGLADPWTGAPSTGTNNYCFYITYGPPRWTWWLEA
jgi:hypothetical protein